MRLVHRPADVDDERILATEVELADSALSQLRGLRFRRALPEGYALVLDVAGGNPFGSGPRRTTVDMLFVRVALDVVWLVDEEVVATKRLQPWRGVGYQRADTIVELPAGAAEGVSAGDAVRLEETGASEP